MNFKTHDFVFIYTKRLQTRILAKTGEVCHCESLSNKNTKKDYLLKEKRNGKNKILLNFLPTTLLVGKRSTEALT